jgi:phosphate transport system ATP-binding protein
MYELYPGQRVEGEVLLDGENILMTRHDLPLLRARIWHGLSKANAFSDVDLREHRVRNPTAKKNRQGRAKCRSRSGAPPRSTVDEVKDHLLAEGSSLSGGQQQRLCIARTLAIQSEVILLDEPCSAIDPISSAKIEQTIHELKQDHTIVIVTHNLQQAARISDFAGFMLLGELIEFDATRGLFMTPRDPRTHHFVTGRFG